MAALLVTRPPIPRLLTGALFAAPVAAGAGLLSHSALAAGAALPAVIVAWTRPDLLLGLLMAAAPMLRSLNTDQLSPETIAIVKTCAALLLGGIWLVRLLASQASVRFSRGIRVLGASWLALIGLATVVGADPAHSLSYLPLTVAGASVFAVTYHAGRTTRRRLLLLVLAMTVALGILVLLQYLAVTYGFFSSIARFIIEPRTQAYYAENPLGETAGRFRPSGTMFHPNSMGLFFAVVMPFATAVALASRAPQLWRLAGASAAVASLIGLYATNSRAATLAAAVGLLIVGLHAGYRRLLVAGTLILGLGGLIALSVKGDALRQAIESFARVEAGLSGRGTIWENTRTLIAQSPFLGVGPANFSTQYVSQYGYFLPNSVQEQMGQIWAVQNIQADRFVQNFHAHNIYLQLAGELGLFGPILFIVTLAWIVSFSRRACSHRSQGALSRALGVATTALASSLAIYGLFDSQYAFTYDAVNLIAGPLLAIGLSTYSQRKALA